MSSNAMVRAFGLTAWGIHQWHIGEVGESYRYLNQSTRTMLDDLVGSEEDPGRRDLQLL